eukprot:SAG11_NODE_8750_length_980_cov_1.188422_1_plen_116_part_00
MLHSPGSSTGDLDAVQRAISAGIDVNMADASGNTALHWASHLGNEPIVDALLRAGADADVAHGAFGHAPIHSAKTVGAAKLLLAAGANPHLCDSNVRSTPLRSPCSAPNSQRVSI